MLKRTQLERATIIETLCRELREEIENGYAEDNIRQTMVYAQVEVDRIVFYLNHRKEQTDD